MRFKAYKLESWVRLPSWGGMVPFNWFEETSLRERRWKTRQYASNTSEINWRNDRTNRSPLSQELSEFCSCKRLSRVRLPSWGGMVPLSWFNARSLIEWQRKNENTQQLRVKSIEGESLELLIDRSTRPMRFFLADSCCYWHRTAQIVKGKILSVQISELSEVAELRWDSASELIWVEVADKTKVKEQLRAKSIQDESGFFEEYQGQRCNSIERTALAVEEGCWAEAGWCHWADSRLKTY